MYDMELKDCIKWTQFERMYFYLATELLIRNSCVVCNNHSILEVVNTLMHFSKDQTHWKRINRNHSMKLFRNFVITQIGIFRDMQLKRISLYNYMFRI